MLPPLNSHASHRPVPSQAPAASQTAAVLEYKCLFSHTIRKKQKTWNDGFLTFHAFNNRVVVFDQDRHRVGDTYVSASDNGVNDGDEITLQQGVLVQVGEPYSAREQDVSQVIVARDTPRKERATARVYPESRAGLTQTSRFSGANRGIRDILQQGGETYGLQTASPAVAEMPAPTGPVIRPRSLKEVLQTPGGSIGRARLPNRSPYEQTHAVPSGLQNAAQPVQVCRLAGPVMHPPEKPRPAKKQRVDNGEAARERLQRSPQKTPEPVRQRPAKPQSEKSRSAISPPVQMIPRKGQHAASPIMVDSDDESTQQSPLVTTPFASRVVSPIALPKAKEKERRKSAQNAPSVPTEETEVEQHRPKKKRKEKKKAERSKPSSLEPLEQVEAQNPTSREIQPRPEPLMERSVNMLRPASNGRRKKIMYRDLLPQEYVSKNSNSKSRERTKSLVDTITEASPDDPPKEKSSKCKSSKEKSSKEHKRKKQKQLLEDVSDIEDVRPDMESREIQVTSLDTGDEGASVPAANRLVSEETRETEEALDDVSVNQALPPDGDNEPSVSAPDKDNPKLDDTEAALAMMSTKDILGDFSFVENNELDGILDNEEPAEEIEVPATPEPPTSPQQQAKTPSPPQETPPPAAPETPPPRAPGQAAPFGPGRLVGAPRTRNLRANQPAFQPPRPVARPGAATAMPVPPALTAPNVPADSAPAPTIDRPARLPQARHPPPPFVPPSHRSPLKRTISAPTSDSPRQKRALTKSYSEMRPLEKGAGALAPVSRGVADDADRGPWSREAFDLFGWRPGDDKGMSAR